MQTQIAMLLTFWAALGADHHVVTHDGVTAHMLRGPFSGQLASLGDGASTPLALDQLSHEAVGCLALETDRAIVAWSPDSGTLTFWTRRGEHSTRRAELVLSEPGSLARARLIADNRHGFAVELYGPEGIPRQVVALARSGILEIRQGAGQTVVVRSPLRYALVPSLIGTDLLFDPQSLPTDKPAYLPSLNMVVGLQEGHDGVFVAVWPPGEQVVRVQVAKDGGRQAFESLALDTAGQSCYLTFLDHPGIWHEEPLRAEYLETHTAITWQRPFEARWIGRFFIDSDNYNFPFYFIAEKQKLWGRYIRGWFEYPMWFDGQQTMVHFEKKFPPQGTLLIYYLDTYRDTGDMLAPVTVMQESLGADETARLLDFEGTNAQVLLSHGNAVCAMTAHIESHVAGEPDAPPQTEVLQYADDVTTFISLIRERVFQFDQFAADMQKMLKSELDGQPALSDALQSANDITTEIRDIVQSDLPDTSLEEVGAWTDEIKRLTASDIENRLVLVKELTQKCRSVAGTQDDLARNLSVVTIQLMEEAARLGSASPEQLRVAEQIIARCRQVLRKPTWWEPNRKYAPKSNPGVH